jgi:hypothetical protein
LNKPEVGQLEGTLEAILARGDNKISLVEAQKLKNELRIEANWSNSTPTISPKEQMARDAYGVVSQQIDKAVELGEKEIGKTDILTTLSKGKALYESGKTSETLLANRFARETGNKMTTGLTDTGTLIGGALLTKDPVKTAGILAAKKTYDRYGNQMMAVGADKLSKALVSPIAQGAMASTLRGASRGAQISFIHDFGDMRQKIEGTPYAAILTGDEKKDNVSIYVMAQQDPEFAALLMNGVNE